MKLRAAKFFGLNINVPMPFKPDNGIIKKIVRVVAFRSAHNVICDQRSGKRERGHNSVKNTTRNQIENFGVRHGSTF